MSNNLEIELAFKPRSQSIYDTFSESGCAFRIPSYQRRFDWERDNIARLFSDIRLAIGRLRLREELSFLGAIILVKENESRLEDHFQGKSLEIVDGQQRLSTLTLMCALLRKRICGLWRDIEPRLKNDEIRSFLQGGFEHCADRLFDVLVQYRASATSRREPIPRLVREDDDQRGSRESNSHYYSLIASFVYQYAKAVVEQTDFRFHRPSKSTTTDCERFEIQLKNIEDEIENIVKGGYPPHDFEDESTSDEDYRITCGVLASSANYRQLCRGFVFADVLDRGREVRESFKANEQEDILELIQLALLANYILDRVVITSVTLDYAARDYAYDIFEALNTTGEPLTAIETIKPKIHKKDPHWANESTGSKKELDELEYFIYRPIEGESESSVKQEQAKQKRARLSKDIVVDFALFLEGKKVPLHLRKQSVWISNAFDRFGGDSKAVRFSNFLKEVAFYRRDFFNYSEIKHAGQAMQKHFPTLDVDDQQLVHFCLAFLERTGTSLVIPLLSRYWINARQLNDFSIFKEAVLAASAFVAIRRSGTDGTAGIDSDFRNIMRGGGKGHVPGKGVAVSNFDSADEIPSTDQLKIYFRSYLESRGFSDKKKWIRKAKTIPIYRKSSAVAKFILLVSANFGQPCHKKPHVLINVRKHLGDLCTFHGWRSEIAESLEHVAPQSLDVKSWSADLLDEDYILDSIGNLSLLPAKANNAISNASWHRKRHFFAAMAAETTEQLESALIRAKKAGAQIKEGAANDLRVDQQSPIIKSIALCEKWDREIVLERAENILDRAWSVLDDWL